MSYFKANGESQKQLMEMVINEVRENRKDIKDIKNVLLEGEGKIAENRASINTLKWALGIGASAIIALFSCIIGGII